MGFHFLVAATTTAINGDQFTLFYVELFRFVDSPFVVTVAAQGIALVLLLERRFAKGNYVCHGLQ